MTEPPIPGTPMESLMLLVWRMRQDLRLQETRAIAHAIIVSANPERSDADKILSTVWDDYRNALLPYQVGMMKNQDQAAIEYLKKEVSRGPLKVVPLAPLTPSTHRRRGRRASREG